MTLDGSPGHAIDKLIGQIADLARNEGACKLLGVDGVLEGQLDIAFLSDPLDWLAEDIANAIIALQDGGDDDDTEEDAEGESLTLDIIVAEYRLCTLILSSVDEDNLVQRVQESIDQRQG